MRGRRAGQGKWAGGRPKDAPNKKGAFTAELPPVRCDDELRDYYEQQAKSAGIKLTAIIRQTLEDAMKRNDIKFLKEQGAHYIVNVGWYLRAESFADVERDDSDALFLGQNAEIAAERLREIDANEEYYTYKQPVINKNGVEINYEHAVEVMDDDIREILHSRLAPCSDQAFFTAYEQEHEKKHGEEFFLSAENPIY